MTFSFYHPHYVMSSIGYLNALAENMNKELILKIPLSLFILKLTHRCILSLTLISNLCISDNTTHIYMHVHTHTHAHTHEPSPNIFVFLYLPSTPGSFHLIFGGKKEGEENLSPSKRHQLRNFVYYDWTAAIGLVSIILCFILIEEISLCQP